MPFSPVLAMFSIKSLGHREYQDETSAKLKMHVAIFKKKCLWVEIWGLFCEPFEENQIMAILRGHVYLQSYNAFAIPTAPIDPTTIASASAAAASSALLLLLSSNTTAAQEASPAITPLQTSPAT